LDRPVTAVNKVCKAYKASKEKTDPQALQAPPEIREHREFLVRR
jgi:hypothetical protein